MKKREEDLYSDSESYDSFESDGDEGESEENEEDTEKSVYTDTDF